MRTNVVQFLAVIASVFIVLSLLKMLSDSTSPVSNSGSLRSNFTDSPVEFDNSAQQDEPMGYVEDDSSAAVETPEQVESEQVESEQVEEAAVAGSEQSGANCFPKDSLSAQDLLPSDESSSKWAQVNPSGKGDLRDQNFLEAGHHIGINTVGQSLRNANRQIRSEPANPQVKVSPWLQSTIDPDVNRRALEIGGSC